MPQASWYHTEEGSRPVTLKGTLSCCDIFRLDEYPPDPTRKCDMKEIFGSTAVEGWG